MINPPPSPRHPRHRQVVWVLPPKQKRTQTVTPALPPCSGPRPLPPGTVHPPDRSVLSHASRHSPLRSQKNPPRSWAGFPGEGSPSPTPPASPPSPAAGPAGAGSSNRVACQASAEKLSPALPTTASFSLLSSFQPELNRTAHYPGPRLPQHARFFLCGTYYHLDTM